MSWQTPSFVEINMSAEIGAYQGDTDDDADPTLRREPPSADETAKTAPSRSVV